MGIMAKEGPFTTPWIFGGRFRGGGGGREFAHLNIRKTITFES
jgi:hypothetical protein